MGRVRVQVKPGVRLRNPANEGVVCLDGEVMVFEDYDPRWTHYWKRRVKEGVAEVLPKVVVKSEVSKASKAFKASKETKEKKSPLGAES